ncbi:MAG TPA: F0F1 ATP synthase subunit epsilon [Beijerinckiaceae bacterium]|jgi:F-type H+-transporting ATPase subunit epsilon|nr:F0F1 ATP synthase subunit epsilon [Beijerinckiaceae bacterium]
MATLHFELVSPERVLFSGEVEAVMLPGTEGDMTVLPGHAPVMTALKTGVVIATNHRDNGERVLVRGGFAEVNAAGVIVLAERATPVEDLTADMIDHEILQAEMMRDATEDFAAKQAADAAIAQLREVRGALQF